jgi:hypothetical protein
MKFRRPDKNIKEHTVPFRSTEESIASQNFLLEKALTSFSDPSLGLKEQDETRMNMPEARRDSTCEIDELAEEHPDGWKHQSDPGKGRRAPTVTSKSRSYIHRGSKVGRRTRMARCSRSRRKTDINSGVLHDLMDVFVLDYYLRQEETGYSRA